MFKDRSGCAALHDCGWKSGGGPGRQRDWIGKKRCLRRNHPSAEGSVSNLVPVETKYQASGRRNEEEFLGRRRGARIGRVYREERERDYQVVSVSVLVSVKIHWSFGFALVRSARYFWRC